MAATKGVDPASEILSEIYTYYDNIMELDCEAMLRQASEIRTNLVAIFNQFSCNLHLIVEDIKKVAQGTETNTKVWMMLSYLGNLVSKFPPIVFVSPTQYKTLNDEMIEKYEKDYHQFRNFLLSRLFLLGGSPSLETIHPTVMKTLDSVFLMYKMKGKRNYKTLLAEILQLSEEICEKLVRIRSPRKRHVDDVMTTVRKEAAEQLTSLWMAGTTIQGFEPIAASPASGCNECEFLGRVLQVVGKIIQNNMSDLMGYYPGSKCDLLYRVLILHHNNGTTEMKSRSFKCLVHLIRSKHNLTQLETGNMLMLMSTVTFTQVVTGEYTDIHDYKWNLMEYVSIVCNTPSLFDLINIQHLHNSLLTISGHNLPLPSQREEQQQTLQIFRALLSALHRRGCPATTVGVRTACLKIYSYFLNECENKEVVEEHGCDLIESMAYLLTSTSAQLSVELSTRVGRFKQLLASEKPVDYLERVLPWLFSVVCSFTTALSWNEGSGKSLVSFYKELDMESMLPTLISKVLANLQSPATSVPKFKLQQAMVTYYYLVKIATKCILMSYISSSDVITTHAHNIVIILSARFLPLGGGDWMDVKPQSSKFRSDVQLLIRTLDAWRKCKMADRGAGTGRMLESVGYEAMLGLAFIRTKFAARWRCALLSKLGNNTEVEASKSLTLAPYLYAVFEQLQLPPLILKQIIDNLNTFLSTAAQRKSTINIDACDAIKSISAFACILFGSFGTDDEQLHNMWLHFVQHNNAPAPSSGEDDAAPLVDNMEIVELIAKLDKIITLNSDQDINDGGKLKLWCKRAALIGSLLSRVSDVSGDSDVIERLFDDWRRLTRKFACTTQSTTGDVTQQICLSFVTSYCDVCGGVKWGEGLMEILRGLVSSTEDLELGGFQCKLIQIIGEVGKKIRISPDQWKLFTWIVTQLCKFVVLKQGILQACVVNILKDICVPHHTTVYNIHELVCVEMVKIFIQAENHRNQQQPSRYCVDDVTDDLTRILNFDRAFDMTSYCIKYIFPVVITSQDTAIRQSLLQYYSELLEKKRCDLVIENFLYIFVFAVVEDHQLPKLFESLESETRIPQKSIVLLNYGSLVQHLASSISLNEENVYKSLQFVNTMKTTKTKTKKEMEISKVLQPDLLSILTFFNAQLRRDETCVMDKKKVLGSLISLFRRMEMRIITNLNMKLVSTLCLAHRIFANNNMGDMICLAWDVLIRRTDETRLASLLCQILVMLLPHIQQHPQQVLSTIRFLVKDKCEHTKKSFNELYFLPDNPLLDEIKLFINKYIPPQSLAQQLEQLNGHIKHKNTEVRRTALKYLATFLRHNEKQLGEICRHQTYDGAVNIFSDVIHSLLTSSPCKEIRVLVGECCGAIGAVNPEWLSNVMSSDNKGKSFHLTLFDDGKKFAYDLISCLVQGFNKSDPSHQDIFAFAIQELLKKYKSAKLKCPTLWKMFSADVRVVLEPHCASRYVLSRQPIELSTLKRPLLNRKLNLTFNSWIGNFSAVIIQMMTSLSTSPGSDELDIFDSCSAVVRHDVNVAKFLLPYVIITSLKVDQFIADFIIQEMVAVLDGLVSTEGEEEMQTEEPSSSKYKLRSQSQKHQHSQLLCMAAHTIFNVLDYVIQVRRTVTTSKDRLYPTKEDWIGYFLDNIPLRKLAKTAFKCRAYERAILYYEDYLRSRGRNMELDDDGSKFLQEVYMEMDESDGVRGVINIQQSQSQSCRDTQVKLLEIDGAHQDVDSYYEKMIEESPHELLYRKGRVKSLIKLGKLSTAISTIDATLRHNQSWESELNTYRMEACWKLGDWKLLDEEVGKMNKTTNDWNSNFAHSLVSINNQDWTAFDSIVENLYNGQSGLLASASSYQSGYEHAVRLHMLGDVQRVADEVRKNNTDDSRGELIQVLEERHNLIRPSFQSKDDVLSLTRVIIPLLSRHTDGEEDEKKFRKKIGQLWLKSSKLARKSLHLQVSLSSLISAQQYQNLPEYYTEYAKYLWQKGESHQAFLALSGLNEGAAAVHIDVDCSEKERKMKAKTMLLLAKLMDQSAAYDSSQVLNRYRQVEAYWSEWEDVHFFLAKYYDRIMTAVLGENRGNGKAHHLYYIIHHYGKSLLFGNSHIYESLTKMLTVWLDFGAHIVKAEKKIPSEDMKKLKDCIRHLKQSLPPYVFYIAFSQLSSRICHPHLPTYSDLKDIICDVISAYPQRALWPMMTIAKSSHPKRASRCQEIFHTIIKRHPSYAKMISDYKSLTVKLLEVCNKQSATLKMSTHFRSLKKLVENKDFSQVIMPLQEYMVATLPPKRKLTAAAESASSANQSAESAHNPFPQPCSYMVGFEDHIDVLNSLQKPKKITIKSNTGKSHIFLCKPRDDLRKDARLTEFSAIVNKCLNKNPECNKRHLKIRTYLVMPINEDNGLIEWLPHKEGIRPILLKIYKQRGLSLPASKMKACMLPKTAPKQKKIEMFKNVVLPAHPPLLFEWFLTKFPDANAWYNARLLYSRSAAVMSMAGYIVGLGDRHGENVLIDSNSGEVLHCDFSCLFNKGTTLEVPEVVPFRLTHNMVDAMGPNKYEGFFRKACEITMTVLREQREPLMSVLKTFLHDPLVEWSKKGQPNDEKFTETKALLAVSDIDRRLRGIVAKNKGLPLSIEGHVHHLIQEATDVDKLSVMYFGWGPHM